MSDVLNMRDTLAEGALAHYVDQATIRAHRADPDVAMAAHILVSERHGKFDLSQMTAYFMSRIAVLEQDKAELQHDMQEYMRIANAEASRVTELEAMLERWRLYGDSWIKDAPMFPGRHLALETAALLTTDGQETK